MDSPLARVILALLCGYLLILMVLAARDWISGEYPIRPDNPPVTSRIRHAANHKDAIAALDRFSRLAEPEKAALINRLTAQLISVEQWLTDIEQTHWEIICLGELHEENTRNFLAEKIFPVVGTDALMLEATPKKLQGLIRRRDAGRDYFPLLDADILNVLRAVEHRNPGLRIQGIEETDDQQSSGRSNSRDRSIAQNFWERYRPGQRHIILFGALHCTNEPNWLFHNLHNRASASLAKRMLNVRVLGEHQSGPVEAFVYFLDGIGVEKDDFVIPDTRALPARIYRWFPLLNRQTLQKYSSLIVFR
jgi:hypothetical protein